MMIFFIIWILLQSSSSEKPSTGTTVTPAKTVTSKKNSGNITTVPTLSTTVPTTTCKANGSCYLNSTLNGNLVTTTPATTKQEHLNESVPLSNFLHSKSKSSDNNKLCVCDLAVDYCDINCCCDEDCSLDNKQVFDHCEKDFHHYDTRYCQYVKHDYVNNTPHEFQINQNGLFCVVRSNLPPSYIVQRKHPLKTLEEAEFQKSNKYHWPFPTVENLGKIHFSNYSYGTPLLIVRNNTAESLQFLKGFVVPHCLITDDVKYLIDLKGSCGHTNILENNYLKPETYFKNITVIANPGLLNASKLKDCPQNVCLKVEPRICNENFEDCVQISRNDTKIKSSCNINTTNELFCINLVQDIKYNFYHNGTFGLKKVDLYMVLKSTVFTDLEELDFTQTTEINFIWWNYTLNYSSHLSGNPGYLIGKPILIANIISVHVPINNTNSTRNMTHYSREIRLYRNSHDFTSNFMVLPYVGVEGVCVLNKHKYTPVEFGFNTFSKCKINDFVLSKNMSAKNICISIQETIFRYWSLNVTNNTLSNKLIGQFGNAYVFSATDWLRPMFKDDIKDILNKTWGMFDYKNKIITCGNISTLLVTEIFHARVDFEDVVNQEKILATTFQFSDFRNVSFGLGVNGTINFNVKIGTQVMFFDITAKKIRKLVDPPSLNIRLPHDFFYPFVKIDNNSVRHTLFKFVMMVCLIFIFTVK